MSLSFGTIGCMITCSRHVLSNDIIAEYLRSNDMIASMWVNEQHRDSAYSHTHLVVMSSEKHTYRAKEIAEFFGHWCNIQPLRKLQDVYLSMAYLCKHNMPVVWAVSQSRTQLIKEHVLSALKSYIRRSPKSAKVYLVPQLTRLEAAWTPKPPPEDSQLSDSVVSENVHEFFPSQPSQ